MRSNIQKQDHSNTSVVLTEPPIYEMGYNLFIKIMYVVQSQENAEPLHKNAVTKIRSCLYALPSSIH